jgi:hypothetical protein
MKSGEEMFTASGHAFGRRRTNPTIKLLYRITMRWLVLLTMMLGFVVTAYGALDQAAPVTPTPAPVFTSHDIDSPPFGGNFYRAPDGKLLQRTFANEYEMPRSAIVVCTDKPEIYIADLRRFARYVMSDRKLAILDGRTPPTDLLREDVEFIYIGHLAMGSDADTCLAHYPELSSFFKATSHEPAMERGILPLGTRTISSIHFDRRKTSAFNNRLLLCHDPQRSCERDLFLALFAIQSDFCAVNAVCDDLFSRSR